MPATISMEEEMALTDLADLLRRPKHYSCHSQWPTADNDEAGALRIVAYALAIIDDLRAKNLRFTRS